MRKELYRLLCSELKAIDLIKHIDLWNHNVEFIEQEENWERPAVFVEFCPIQWNAIVPGVEYRAAQSGRDDAPGTVWRGGRSVSHRHPAGAGISWAS